MLLEQRVLLFKLHVLLLLKQCVLLLKRRVALIKPTRRDALCFSSHSSTISTLLLLKPRVLLLKLHVLLLKRCVLILRQRVLLIKQTRRDAFCFLSNSHASAA